MDSNSPEIPAPPDKSPKPPRPSIFDKQLPRRAFLRGLGLAAAGLALPRDSSPKKKSTSVDTTKPKRPEIVTEKKPYNPTPKEIASVEAIMNQQASAVDITGKTGEEIEVELTNRSLEAAKKHGLTIYDYRTYFHELSQDAYRQEGPQKEFTAYLQKAQEFLERYGIELTLGDDQQQYSYEGRPLDRQTLEQTAIKRGLIGLVSEIGSVPVELIKETGLKKIKLISIGEKKAGYADVDEGNTYYADPSNLGGTGFLHEAYHLYDVNHADKTTMYRDEGFRALNPEQIYADLAKSQNADQYISDDTYTNFYVDHVSQLSDARLKGDTNTAARLQAELDTEAARVVVPTDYSFTNVIEDKAELGSELMDPFHTDRMLDPKKPVLRKKALFLLARFYHNNPALVNFYADIRTPR